MKGDERVEPGEESCDCTLLLDTWNQQRHFQKSVSVNALRFAAAISHHPKGQIEAFLGCSQKKEVGVQVFDVKSRKISSRFKTIELIWYYTKSRIEKIQLAIDELPGAANVVLRVLAANDAAFFHHALTPKLHRELSGNIPRGTQLSALCKEVADLTLFPSYTLVNPFLTTSQCPLRLAPTRTSTPRAFQEANTLSAWRLLTPSCSAA